MAAATGWQTALRGNYSEIQRLPRDDDDADSESLTHLHSSQSPDGELDGGQGYEGGERFGEVLIVFGQTAVAAEPREGSLDHPAAGQHHEPFHVIRTLTISSRSPGDLATAFLT